MSARTAATSPGAATSAVRSGATLMAVAAAGFIGYKDQIQQFSAGALLSGKGLLDARAANRPPGISPGHGSRDPR